MKRIGIVGAGNVGSSLVMELARILPDDDIEIELAARNPKHAQAAIMDAGSIYPVSAANISSSSGLKGDYDIVVVTAGLMPGGMDLEELLQANIDIVVKSLEEVEEVKTLIVIGTPVDRLNEVLAKHPQFASTQLVGYGGELDKARASYAMIKHGIAHEGVFAVGEHGPRTIPVYDGEEKYQQIREESTTALGKIMKSVDKARNLASGYQLARLVAAFCSKEVSVQCVSIVDEDFAGLSITWPYEISSTSLKKKTDIKLGTHAQAALDELVETRKSETK